MSNTLLSAIDRTNGQSVYYRFHQHYHPVWIPRCLSGKESAC